MYSSKALYGGSIKEANGRSQWFFSFLSVVSSLGETRPLLAGYVNHEALELGWPVVRVNGWLGFVNY